MKRGKQKGEKDNENKWRKKKNVALLPREMKLEKDIKKEENTFLKHAVHISLS